MNASASKEREGHWMHVGDVTETLQSLTEISGEEKEEEQNGKSEDS